MHITRKQALVTLVAGIIPWLSRRAYAEIAPRPSEPLPRALPSPTQAQYDALQKRVAELEQRLANQVAFVKDSAGNLSLDSPGNVSIKGLRLSMKSTEAELTAAAVLTFKGGIIKLN